MVDIITQAHRVVAITNAVSCYFAQPLLKQYMCNCKVHINVLALYMLLNSILTRSMRVKDDVENFLLI